MLWSPILFIYVLFVYCKHFTLYSAKPLRRQDDTSLIDPTPEAAGSGFSILPISRISQPDFRFKRALFQNGSQAIRKKDQKQVMQRYFIYLFLSNRCPWKRITKPLQRNYFFNRNVFSVRLFVVDGELYVFDCLPRKGCKGPWKGCSSQR